MGDRPEPAAPGPGFPPALRALRKAMAPRLDRRSAEVWFAEYPYRQDPDAVRRERAGLIAFLTRHGVPAEADDELDNSPAVQLEPEVDLDRAAALVAEWVQSPD